MVGNMAAVLHKATNAWRVNNNNYGAQHVFCLRVALHDVVLTGTELTYDDASVLWK